MFADAALGLDVGQVHLVEHEHVRVVGLVVGPQHEVEHLGDVPRPLPVLVLRGEGVLVPEEGLAAGLSQDGREWRACSEAGRGQLL